MTELVFDGPFEGGTDDKVFALFEEINLVYRIRNIPNRINQLTLSMFYHGPSEWAVFTGKAAETRHLVDVLCDICNAWMGGKPQG